MNQVKFIVCAECKNNTVRNNAMQKYCMACSAKKHADRGYSKRQEKKPISAKTSAEKARLEARGRAISKQVKRDITWPSTCDDDLNTMVRVAIPFSWDFSKNRIYGHGNGNGHVYMRQSVRRAQGLLESKIRSAIAGRKFFPGKVWIDIFVQKPNNRGDAVNVVDSVCDAVKKAIEIDDRYFSIRKLDWEVVKEDPQLFVGVGQSITEPHVCCSYCGRLVPETNMSSHKRTCKNCRFDIPLETIEWKK